MTLFKNKYRIESARLLNWDYRWPGAYFITICTKDRAHYFGEIINAEMICNEMGKLAWDFWQEIPAHFPYIALGAFVVMPDHIHGVLIIRIDLPEEIPPLQSSGSEIQTMQCIVSDQFKNQKMAAISPKAGSISTIIRSYKSAVSKHIHKFHPGFAWQPRFHDHIIRDKISYDNIQHYIISNPQKWDTGKKRS
ncbi:MAG: hypothetical protein JWQ27_2183 [Ferruginibacter sp.]|nr:hypothetical protein [Ferruginibacter sp.]